ncbi:hypothetical protein KC345_g82 [Hortaea werneckii]|nr:hypothetical protein KC345_g82 [Hortaea werneckii]
MGRFPDHPPVPPTFPNAVDELPHLNTWGSETDQQGGGEPRWSARTLCRLTVPANLNQCWRCRHSSPRRRINRLLPSNLDEPQHVARPLGHSADHLAD